MWTIIYYETEERFCPVKKFIDSLFSEKLRVKAMRDIELLEKLGTAIREPYSKLIEPGLFELRIKFSRNNARVFFFFYIGEKIILTNGFLKKTNKTPGEEMKRALEYKAEYEKRMKK